MKVKKYLFVILILLLMFPYLASAKSFVIHLYYDNKTKALRFDKMKTEEVSLNKKLFTSQIDFLEGKEVVQTGDYSVILYDTSNSETGRLKFNPSNGAFDIAIPFFVFSGKITIINNATQKEILTSDLSKFLTCNANGICELEKNESVDDCLVDCGTSKPAYSEETKKTLEKNNGAVKDPDTGEILLKNQAYSANDSTDDLGASFSSKEDGSIENKQTPERNNNNFYIYLTALVITVLIVLAVLYLRKRKNL